MSDSYPTVGLAVDLNEIVALQAALSSITAQYSALGDVADSTAARLTAAAAAAGSGDMGAAAKANTKVVVDADAATAQSAKEAAALRIAAAVEYASIVRQQEAEITGARRAADAENAAIDAAARTRLTFNMAMTKQTFAEMTADERAYNAALAADSAASNAAAQSALTFRMAMTRQQMALAAADEAQQAASVARQVGQQQTFMSSLQEAAATVGKGRSALLEYRAAQLGISSEAAPFIQALKDSEGAALRGGVAIATLTRELVVMGREILRGNFSRLAGSATVAGQALGELLPTALLVGGAIIALVGPIVLLAAEALRGQAEMAKFNNELQVTGQYASLTADQLSDAANKVAESTHTSIGGAIAVFNTLASSGRVYGDELLSMGDAAVKLGDLTGQNAAKISQSFLKMAGDASGALNELNGQYHFLSLGEYEHINSLIEQGQKQEAVTLLFKDFKTYLDQQTKDLGILAQAIKGVGDWWTDTTAKMMAYGKAAPVAQQIAQQQQLIANAQSYQGAATMRAEGEDPNKVIAIAQAKIDALNARQQTNTATGANSVQTQKQIDAANTASALLSTLRSNVEKAQAEKNALQHDIDLNGSATDPITSARVSYERSHQTQLNAAIDKRYDRADHTRASVKGDSGAQAAVDKTTADISALNSQLDTEAKFDLSPLAEDQAKIGKAYDETMAKFADSTNAKKQAFAVDAATLAADKERLTILNALAGALIKEAQADSLRVQDLQASIANIQTAHAALNSYYSDGVQNSALYVGALDAEAQANLDNVNAQTNLGIAQKFGVTSLNDISAAVQKSLGVSKQRGDQIQDEAQKTAKLADAVNALTAVQKAETAIADQHTAALQTISDQNAMTAAYAAGALGLAQYDRQKAIDAALTKVARPLSPNESAAVAAGATDPRIQEQAQATADALALLSSAANENQAKLNYQMETTLRLASETTAQRAVDANTQQRIHDLEVQTGQAVTAQTAQMIQQEEIAKKLATDLAQLTISIEDSVQKAFDDTGKLDFTSLQTGITQALRKAVYDALLAKPIDMLINATINGLTSQIGSASGGLSSLFSSSGLASLFGGGGTANSPTGEISNGLTTLDGGLSQVQNAVGNVADVGQQTNSLLGSIGGSLQGLPGAIGEELAVIGIGQVVGGAISHALGIKQNAQNATYGAVAGAILGGPIGAILGDVIGGLLGPQPSNFTASATFQPGGEINQIGGDSPNASTTAAIKSVASTLEQTITNLAAIGINANGLISSIEIGQRDSSKINLTNGQQIQTATGDPQALAEALDIALLKNAKYTDPNEQALVQQMIQANRSFTDISNSLQAYAVAQNDFKTVNLAFLQATNPTAYAVQNLQASQLARRQTLSQEASAGDFTNAQIAQINAQLPVIESAEITNALDSLSTAAGGAAHTLADFKNAQAAVITYVQGLKSGALSPLSPQAQLANDQSTFASQLALAQAGNYTALQGITTVADSYLKDAQTFYGSSGAYNDLFNSVSDQLTNLGSSSITDPQTAAINQANQDLQTAIANASLEIVQAIQTSPTVGSGGTGAGTGAGGTGTANNPWGAAFTKNGVLEALAANAEAIVAAHADSTTQVVSAIQSQDTVKTALLGGLAA